MTVLSVIPDSLSIAWSTSSGHSRYFGIGPVKIYTHALHEIPDVLEWRVLDLRRTS